MGTLTPFPLVAIFYRDPKNFSHRGSNSLPQRSPSLLPPSPITLEISRTKNINKNPFAEKAIMELEGEFLLQDPTNLTITPMNLALSIARLNSRIRSNGLLACELCTQRDQ